MAEARHISFSPPDITQAEIDEVVDTLQSGWITTGPKTKQLERDLASFIGTNRAACLGSATAALECGLRLLDIGPGDEVITSAYTYTASASAICHVGATPVLVDVARDSFEMDYGRLAEAITPKTKAVIPVDIGGRMVDYDQLEAALDSAKSLWNPRGDVQARFNRLPVLADGAHSLGARYHGKNAGQAADLTAFSFHAVKNFTTEAARSPGVPGCSMTNGPTSSSCSCRCTVKPRTPWRKTAPGLGNTTSRSLAGSAT